jgi:hypothetical protein
LALPPAFVEYSPERDVNARTRATIIELLDAVLRGLGHAALESQQRELRAA